MTDFEAMGEYLDTLQDGERIVETGESGMRGRLGTVIIKEDGTPSVIWDEFTPGEGRMTTSATWGTRRCCEQPLFELGWNDVVRNVVMFESHRLRAIHRLCRRLISGELELPREDALYREGVHTAAGRILRNETTEFLDPIWFY